MKISRNTGSTYDQEDGEMGGTREPPIAVPKGLSGSTENGCRARGRTEARLRLTEGAGDSLHAAVDGYVSEAEGLGASRVHDDRWGRTAQTKEVNQRRVLRAE